MNDRYLFRGKRTDNGEWAVGGFSEYSAYQAEIYEPGEFCSMPVQVLRSTVGQCTGLKDKNGKLIFEGDFIKIYVVGKDDEKNISRTLHGKIVLLL